MPPKGSKRKRPSTAAGDSAAGAASSPFPPPNYILEQASKHLGGPSASTADGAACAAEPHPEITNPDINPEVLDSKEALRASPDAEEGEHVTAAGEEVDVRGQGDTEMLDVQKVTGGRGQGRGRGGSARGGRGKGKAVASASSGRADPATLEQNGVKAEDMAFVGSEGQGAKGAGVKREESPLSELEDVNELEGPPAKRPKKTPTKTALAAKKANDEIKAFKAAQAAAKKEKAEAEKAVKKEDDDGHGSAMGGDGDNDGEGADEVKDDVDNVKQAARRPPPVNSDYLPLPWKGRLGYACLNTYLRFSNPPVFSSRTCRIASIIEHRHPLKDPSQPEHATKNRPDTTQPASVRRGMEYVEALGLQNARDIPKMLRWNAKYGIRFMRLSSEMFPFASHEEYGYKLASFAKETLEEAGKVAAEFNCRLTTHPGQYTQLGSPRPSVIENAIRDLEYHDEMLSLLNLPEQLNKDAVMILHLGGTFGDKDATLQRFKDNYLKLPQSVKNRLVLENDDVSWSVHDLLPVCEELNIPMVLDYHHHNIIFDSTKLREGTKDIIELYPRIKATWDRKGITQKMHYSEPCPEAVTGRERRKHNPRPATLPPCANDMDLMIEAKDKEQALFEIMRSLKLPGWDTFNNVVPYERDDENKPEPNRPKKKPKKKTKKQLAAEAEDPSLIEPEETEEEPEKILVPEEEVGMGGPDNRVYWPPGMEEWLRPKKREVKKKNKDGDDVAEGGVMTSDLWAFAHPTPMNVTQRKAAKARMEEQAKAAGETEKPMDLPVTPAKAANGASKGKVANGGRKPTAVQAKRAKAESDQDSVVSTMTESPEELEDDADVDFSAEETDKTPATIKSTGSTKRNGSRRGASKRATYREDSGSEMDVD